ncbi:MAG: DUF5131 family protein, partial [Mycobacterium sp.]|nr:DUF5131 family protein [Mycobacterium sp.]
HTYQILTKRHARMRSLMRSAVPGEGWPLPNVWLGVSVENQRWADIRIPALLDTPAAVRFLSCEPLLGPVDLTDLDTNPGEVGDAVSPCDCDLDCGVSRCPARVDWVIVGGESGPCSRPMHPDWARSLRDQCQAAGVPFFFKQWGNFRPGGDVAQPCVWVSRDGVIEPFVDHHRQAAMVRVGKKHAGRMLDGRTWDEFPHQATQNGVVELCH